MEFLFKCGNAASYERIRIVRGGSEGLALHTLKTFMLGVEF